MVKKYLPSANRPRWRGVLHAVTAPVVMVVGSVATFTLHGLAAIAVAVYVATLTASFTLSALYHRIARGTDRSPWWRRLDHAAIHVLVAGTYTPICVDLLPHRIAAVLLVVVWVGAAVGATAKLLNRWWKASSVLYLIQGWVAVVLLPLLVTNYGWVVVVLVVTGGMVYTAGALVFFTHRPGLWPTSFGYHELWHVATVVAAGLHFVAVWLIVS